MSLFSLLLVTALSSELLTNHIVVAEFSLKIEEMIKYRDREIEKNFRLSLDHEFDNFSKHFDVESATEKDKNNVLKTLHKLTFYSKNPQQASYVTTIFDAIAEKTPEHFSMVTESLIVTKQFSTVKKMGFIDTFENFEIKENFEFKIGGPPSHWQLDIEKGQLIKTQVRYNITNAILVVVSLSCPFSIEAIDYIYNNDKLKGKFSRDSYWLIATNSEFDPEAIDHFTRKYNEFNFIVVNVPQEWPMIDSWLTPTFYFKPKRKIQGWLGEETVEKIEFFLYGN